MEELKSINDLSLDITNFIMPWIAILVSLIVAFWLKDFVSQFLTGLKFKWDPAFNEGDNVLLEGEDAMIVKIGVRQTVFGVYSDRGYTWRYISNDKIYSLKLEKVIKKDLHIDTEMEKAQKLKTLIDKVQDEEIARNSEMIAKNKEAIDKLNEDH